MEEFKATEHKEITRLVVKTLVDGSDISYAVGRPHSRVTRIEQCEKSGMHSYIPYLRVYAGDEVIAELCQHNIESIHFD